MNDSLLAGLADTADVKDDGDFLGGFTPFETDIYDFTVKLAYLDVAKSGAKCMNVVLTAVDGRELRQQLWLTSGTAKGCLPYYTNKKTLEKHFLPGFIAAKHLALLTTGKEVHQLALETRHIKLYSYEAKAEVPTEVNMCVEMIGKPVTAGVTKNIVDVNSDSGTVDAAGKKIYIPSGKTRVENEAEKLFRTRDRMTVTEITAKATEAVFAGKWLGKNKGQTKDKTSTQSGVEGKATVAAAMTNAASADLGALFA